MLEFIMFGLWAAIYTKKYWIKKYGEIIGVATNDINMGDWIHTHNIKSYYLEEIEK